MSEHKMNKWLYNFSVTKEIETEKTVEEVVNNEPVKVTRKVKEKKDIKLAIKRPNRMLYEDAELFYGVQLANGIRAGLMTKTLLLKRYREDGGALSEGDVNYLHEITQQLTLVENDLQRAISNFDNLEKDANEVRIKGLTDKKTDLLKELQAFESINNALFAHTAETKAQMKTANWWTVQLAFWDEASDGNLVPFFKGDKYEERMKFWDDAYDEGDSFVIEVLAKFSLLVNLWLVGAQTEEDFRKAEQEQIVSTAKEEVKAPLPAGEPVVKGDLAVDATTTPTEVITPPTS